MIERRDLNYFTSPEFIRLDVRTGVLRNRAGTRMVAISEDFLRGFVIACEHETGPAASLVLRRCGEFFGQRLARRFESELGLFAGVSLRDRNMVEFSILIVDMWHGCGFGHIMIDWSTSQHGFLAVELEESPMKDIGPSGHMGEDMFVGILGGFLGSFADTAMRCVQSGDARLGDREGTTFIVAIPELVRQVESLRAGGSSHGQIVTALSN